jgi:23S rRNA pseudouridine1911/1915/1917 synthase
VLVPRPEADPAPRPNPAITVPILHEEAGFLIVDKPAGMVTQPGKGHATDAMLNGIFALRDGLIGKMLLNLGVRRDYGLLHRLDRETSGLLVVAKSPSAYDQLRRDFEARNVDKEYLALVAGIPAPRQGVVQARLKEVEIPNPDRYGSTKKVVISRQGQEAISAYRVLATSPDDHPPASLVHVKIKTGRLHQIRAHMLFLNCQVLGDPTYQPDTIRISDYPRAPRLALHAARLGFRHPDPNGIWVLFESPLPADLAAYARKLELPLP